MLVHLPWESGFPTDTAGHECVGLNFQRKIQNTPCNEAGYYSDGVDDTKPGLGYVCEARVIHDVTRTTTCHFPFIHNGVKYTSCSREPVTDLNPDGEPWCTTEVDDNGEAIEDKMILCQDEGNIIFHHYGVGTFCEMPFLRDRVYHDYCTRKSSSGPDGVTDNYWCPVPEFYDPGNTYVFGRNMGYCTEYIYPPG